MQDTSAPIEWRLRPTLTRDEDIETGNTRLSVRARIFTDPSHGPHEPKYCECVRSFGVGILVSRERLDDIADAYGGYRVEQYIDELSKRLLEFAEASFVGPEAAKFTRDELQRYALIDIDKLGQA